MSDNPSASDETYKGTLSPLIIERIKTGMGVPGPGEITRRMAGLVGFAEAERLDLKQEKPAVAAAIQALVADRSQIDVWRLKTEALMAAGYCPGDIVLVDLTASPAPQDVVCAQVYDWTQGAAGTIWRVYDPPFLVGAGIGRDRTAFKPMLVDNDRVTIKGVIVESLRLQGTPWR